MPDRPQFVFVTCQVGAEEALKGELARNHPELHLAFSRPGFLTFKLPADHALRADFDLGAVFARSQGFCLGQVCGTSPQVLAEAAWQRYGQRPVRRLHVWQRGDAPPEEAAAESWLAPPATVARQALDRGCPQPQALAPNAGDPRQPAEPGEFVLDCVLVEPDRWWIGYHRAGSIVSRWPGGIMPLALPAHAVSRAWLKMEEALRWSQLPIAPGARCAELGSAPGGSSQALLERGLVVVGIDPAAMDPAVLADPHFTHVRLRARQVRRREFRKIRWLTADMNVAPDCTLDAVEAVVTHPTVRVRGMLLTLKLPDWKLAEMLPVWLGRVRGWGFNRVDARQLVHNRQEVCVAALKKPFRR